MGRDDITPKALKEFLVRRLRLEKVDPESIADDAPLAGGTLNLDSIDLLELVVGLEKEYGVAIADVGEGRRALGSVKSLAEFLAARRPSG